jgi:methionyl-tRNA synthetase
LCEKADYSPEDANLFAEAPSGYHEALNNYAFDKALETLWQNIAELNQDIDRLKPWDLLRKKDKSAINKALSEWLSKLKNIAYWASPFIPETSGKILHILTLNPISSSGPLFPK